MKKPFILLLIVSVACSARAGAPPAISSINSSAPYDWGANIGWDNWYANDTDGVYIGPLFCYGYIYSANCGWINVGNGSPVNGIAYSQSATDFGVNIVNGVYLNGYAWGANIGWINFGIDFPAGFPPTDLPMVSMATGQLSGYAWSANCGWINLNSSVGNTSYGVIALNTLSLSVNSSTTTVTLNGIPGATYTIQYATKVTGPWMDLLTGAVASSNGVITDSFPTSSSDPTLYFRAILVSP
jgi:hypothetical protein